MVCHEANLLLDAYIDGELELNRQLEVEEHLALCAACKKSALIKKNQRDSVRANILVYKAPPELKRSIRAALRKESKREMPWIPRFRNTFLAAAAIIVISFLGAGIWMTISHGKDQELIAQAISNHVHSLLADHVLDVASSDRNTISPWFTRKLNYSPPITDLANAGYKLVGGRIDMLDKHPVAAIVYQHENQFINVFVWPTTRRSIAFEDKVIQGCTICGWHQGGLNYLIVSELDPDEMENFEDQLKDRKE
jgi:anti-sigma factor RsiW